MAAIMSDRYCSRYLPLTLFVALGMLVLYIALRPCSTTQTAIRERHKEDPRVAQNRTAIRLEMVGPRKSIPSDLMVELENNFPDQEDPRLAAYIRQRWIVEPSTKPYSLTKMETTDFSQIGQSPLIDKELGGRTNGFFIECGAFGGEELSNSLFFERERNWNGLLIEADPTSYAELLSKNRNAFSINACVSTTKATGKFSFKPKHYLAGLTDNLMDEKMKTETEYPAITVNCFPLTSMLNALGVTKVDYFSLDIEGPELEVLQTIPFDRITIDIITIEYRWLGSNGIDQQKTLDKLEKFRQFFKKLGTYHEVGILPKGADNWGLDVIFKRN